jgi:uncharacterized protein
VFFFYRPIFSRPSMNDKREKLQALSEQLGLKTGSEVARIHKESPATSKPKAITPLGGKAPEAHPGSRETLADLTARLRRVRGGDLESGGEDAPVVETQYEMGEYEIDRVVEGHVVGEEEDGFFLLRRDFPLDHMHGSVCLGEALGASAKAVAFSAADPDLEKFDPRTALFMDTETTGLSGGAGTVAFLVGVGYFTEDAFRLDQCFMRDYDDEEPMLEFLRERFEGRDTVVGYNSKSFDLPLLRTRFIQNRIPFRLDGALHYDLVHAARRFFKRRLPNCRLGTIESDVLNLHRQDDVPSHLIPELWLEYLHSRDARPLEGVFYHHRMDILSLAALVAWISQVLQTADGQGFEHIEDRLSVVRLHYTQKQYPEVIESARSFLENDASTPLRRECLQMLGMAHKRRNEFEEMEAAFTKLLEEFPHDLSASVELAKHHEHRSRDLGEAEKLCVQAIEYHRDELTPGETTAMERRLQRIQKKMARMNPEFEE